MRKTVLILTVLALLSANAYTQQEQPWSFGSWLSEGFQKTMERMEKEFEKMKQEFAKIKLFGPQVKTQLDKEKKIYTVRVELPGYEKDKVKISLDDPKKKDMQQVLTIEASKYVKTTDPKTKKVETKEEKFKWSETLPKGAKGKKADAEFKDGVLTVKVPVEIKEEDKKITILVK